MLSWFIGARTSGVQRSEVGRVVADERPACSNWPARHPRWTGPHVGYMDTDLATGDVEGNKSDPAAIAEHRPWTPSAAGEPEIAADELSTDLLKVRSSAGVASLRLYPQVA